MVDIFLVVFGSLARADGSCHASLFRLRNKTKKQKTSKTEKQSRQSGEIKKKRVAPDNEQIKTAECYQPDE